MMRSKFAIEERRGLMSMLALAANVMIHESGNLQVIDFGVAGVLQTNVDKRSTVIGTAHWMAPEMHKLAPPQGLNYGTEVSNHLEHVWTPTSSTRC